MTKLKMKKGHATQIHRKHLQIQRSRESPSKVLHLREKKIEKIKRHEKEKKGLKEMFI